MPIVEPGSDRAEELGFTKEKFGGWLWETKDEIILSLVISRQPGAGNLTDLFNRIWKEGKRAAVPTPMRQMKAILVAKGFTQHNRNMAPYGLVEVWTKDPPGTGKG